MDQRLDENDDVVVSVKGDETGADPGDDRQCLAHKAAREGENRRQADDRNDADIERVQEATVPRRTWRRRSAGARRSTSSLRWPTGSIVMPSLERWPRA